MGYQNKLGILAASLITAISLCVLYIAVDHGEPQQSQLEDIVGLWEGDIGYILIMKDSNNYRITTSIDKIRPLTWKIDRKRGANVKVLTNKTNMILAIAIIKRDKKNECDTITIQLKDGSTIVLRREIASTLGFWRSLGSYTRLLSCCGFVFPDGIFRLLTLYLLTCCAIAPLMRIRFLQSLSLQRSLSTVLLLVLGCPIAGGLIYGLLFWIANGWWNPLGAGKAAILTAAGLMLLPAIIFINEIKPISKNKPKWRKIVYIIFLLFEIAKLGFDIATVAKWLQR